MAGTFTCNISAASPLGQVILKMVILLFFVCFGHVVMMASMRGSLQLFFALAISSGVSGIGNGKAAKGGRPAGVFSFVMSSSSVITEPAARTYTFPGCTAAFVVLVDSVSACVQFVTVKMRPVRKSGGVFCEACLVRTNVAGTHFSSFDSSGVTVKPHDSVLTRGCWEVFDKPLCAACMSCICINSWVVGSVVHVD